LNPASGQIAGTATAGGTFTFSVVPSNKAGAGAAVSYTVTVTGGAVTTTTPPTTSAPGPVLPIVSG
jgi:hypothetical protein